MSEYTTIKLLLYFYVLDCFNHYIYCIYFLISLYNKMNTFFPVSITRARQKISYCLVTCTILCDELKICTLKELNRSDVKPRQVTLSRDRRQLSRCGAPRIPSAITDVLPYLATTCVLTLIITTFFYLFST